MKAEIISIGTELVSGQNLDTNSQWLSRRLAEIGIPVHWHTTLADDLAENIQAIRVAAARAGLILITGGLGPTQDDLTREALAAVAGVPLVLDQASLDAIQELFARRGRTMPERNRAQALFPSGGEVIPNAMGTAPGILLRLLRDPGRPEASDSALVAAMPGVPSEMKAMFERELKPRLLRLGLGAGVVVERKINCFGAGESAVEEKLLDLTRRGHEPEVGITVSDAAISLRILARGPDETAARARIAPVEALIRERLGSLVYGVDDEDLQEVVARLLRQRHLTLSVAEGVTGGVLSGRLTQVPGISQCYRGGLVAYGNDVKTGLLGVPEQVLAEHGAVSAAVAEAMAAGCRERLRTDLALSTVGLAGPAAGTEEKPVGLVYVALASARGCRHQSWNWLGTRSEIQSRTAKMALNLLRLHLEGVKPPP